MCIIKFTIILLINNNCYYYFCDKVEIKIILITIIEKLTNSLQDVMKEIIAISSNFFFTR